MVYLAQAYMTDDAKALLPEAERELYENLPAWATAAFAIAVFGGLLGSLALLIKKKWAIPLFLLSLLGIIVQLINNLLMINNIEDYIMPIIVLIIGVFLYTYSKKSKTNGWLN